MQHGEFRDDRLVTVYDVAFPWSRDDDFFLSVLAEQPATDVLDLGCGTGRLAIAMVERGYRVTGVDPARASPIGHPDGEFLVIATLEDA